MFKSFNSITGAELLRADIMSQQVFIESSSRSGKKPALIGPSQFWGSESKCGLYYDYRSKENRGWTEEKSGWNDYSLKTEAHLDPSQTEAWFKNNAFCEDESTITVIQGYAGCGKTIFVNSLLCQFSNDNDNVTINDVYVDYDNNASENGYIANAIRNKIASCFVSYMKDDKGLEIYEKFVTLLDQFTAISSASITELIPLFRPEGELSKILRDLYEHRKDSERIASLQKDFRSQFICATTLIARRAKGKLRRTSHFDSLKDLEDSQIRLLLEIYLGIYFILMAAYDSKKQHRPTIVLFDNLDIIDNPQHIAFMISKMQEILFKLQKMETAAKDNLYFNVLIAVRKVTYALVASFMEVRNRERGYLIEAKFLDISNLYSSTQILKHKANILVDRFDEFIPYSARKRDLIAFLRFVQGIPADVLDEISISELFNHNIRACANVLEYAMQYMQRDAPKSLNTKLMSQRCSSTIWLHNICAVLHDNDIWNNLGFSTYNKDESCFPASLSRLILTYLYNQRRTNQFGADTIEVSFREIVHMFENLPGIAIRKKAPRSIKEDTAEKHFSIENARKNIVRTISQMLKRNSKSDGIDPRYEKELWRRPIYFTHYAFPLINSAGEDITQLQLEQQLEKIDDTDAKIVSFCITDEGYTFIEKIVTSFEFFSVRINGKKACPLCYLTDVSSMNEIIGKVYDLVEETVKDHRWLMEFYVSHHSSSSCDAHSSTTQAIINDYLNKPFHPKTREFSPQLHIVRVIFDHIYALNDYRDYLINRKIDNLKELNECLVGWIGRYLELYRTNFYSILDGTSGSFNNVFLDLKYLYWLVFKESDYLPTDSNGDFYISINRTNPSKVTRANQSAISDEELSSQAMLIGT